MFVYNCKINIKFWIKILLFLLFSTGLAILIFVLINFFKAAKTSSNSMNSTTQTQDNIITVRDSIPQNSITNIQSNNYTNILKATHENINDYVGLEINFTGYVYRVSNFTDSQFVLARNMIISSNLQYVVVGFLCNSNEISNYDTNTWVNITGKITKGSYNNKDIPIVEISDITKVDEPQDSLVYPPDNYYIPTANMF